MRNKTASTLMAAAVVAVPAAMAQSADAGVIGLADNKAIAYQNSQIDALGLKYARISVAYDAYRTASGRKSLKRVYGAATKAGYKPLIVFSGSKKKNNAPTAKRIAAAVKYLSKYRAGTGKNARPREFSLYNEPNYEGYFKKRPTALGEAYARSKRSCSKCTILGGDLLDTPSGTYRVDSYARKVERGARRNGKRITLWGLHNYNDLNNFRTYSKSGTGKLLKATKAKVWLTETGGVVDKPSSNRSGEAAKFKGEGVEHALKANQFLFGKNYLGRRSTAKRISRTYIYQGIGGAGGEWDSGLIGADGTLRSGSLALIAGKKGKYKS